jgi:DNA-binding MarR family transcriptional regulator
VSGRKKGSRATAQDDESRPGGSAPQIDVSNLTFHLGYLVGRLQRWIFKDFIQTLAPFDLRPVQYSVVLVVEVNPGLTQMAVALALGIERARLVLVIDSLEARDLVKRAPSPRDRRSHALHLTPNGVAVLAQIRAAAAEHERHVAERLGPANHQLLLKLLADFAAG